MPATTKHIEINFQRIAALQDAAELKSLLAEVRNSMENDGETNLNKIWNKFVSEADDAKIADQIPGTVGRSFALKYGTAKAKGPRGQLFTLSLTSAALKAFEHYSDKVPFDGFSIVGETDQGPWALETRNRAKAAKSIQKVIDFSQQQDINTPAKDAAAMRNALKAVARKVEPSQD